jgi:RNA 3'-terminal phosphate cyclase (ATP)
MIEIDGSYREGGGQILRTALSLSCLFQKTFRIFNIRKGRKRPGLMPQHLTAVRAAQMLSTAEVKGDNTGSAELSFFPREVKSGGYFFDIGTAGSTSLVLQTLVPAIVFSSMFSGTTCKAEPRLDSIVEENAGRKKGDTEKSGDKTTITLKGGTHVPLSPSFDYMADVFIPVLKMIGLDVRLSIDTYGFYPRGGGKIRAVISPAGGDPSIEGR